MGGFTNSKQTMLVATQMSSGLLDGQASGIMGLAFEALASTESTPLWQVLLNNNQLASPEMSFWLTREIDNRNAKELEFGGEFTLGGTNSTLFTGDIEFINMPSLRTQTFWLLTMTGKFSRHVQLLIVGLFEIKIKFWFVIVLTLFCVMCRCYGARKERISPYWKLRTLCHRHWHYTHWWSFYGRQGYIRCYSRLYRPHWRLGRVLLIS